MTEYLFRNPELLDEALNTAIDDNTFRSDDLEFTFAARVSLPATWPPLTALTDYDTGLVRLRLIWRLRVLPGPLRADPEILCASIP